MKLLLVVAAVLGASVATSLDCSDDLIALECMTKGDMTGGSANGFPVDKEGLDAACKRTTPIFQCFNEYAEKCQNSDDRAQITYYKEQYTVVKDICDDQSDLRKRYLENSKCLSVHGHKSAESCNEGSVVPGKKPTKEECGPQLRTLNCYVDTVKEKCGSSAAQVIADIMKPTKDYVTAACKSY